jgi:hypothetical protein
MSETKDLFNKKFIATFPDKEIPVMNKRENGY